MGVDIVSFVVAAEVFTVVAVLAVAIFVVFVVILDIAAAILVIAVPIFVLFFFVRVFVAFAATSLVMAAAVMTIIVEDFYGKVVVDLAAAFVDTIFFAVGVLC